MRIGTSLRTPSVYTDFGAPAWCSKGNCAYISGSLRRHGGGGCDGDGDVDCDVDVDVDVDCDYNNGARWW